MPDNPELHELLGRQIDQKLKGLSEQFERERNERIEQFTEVAESVGVGLIQEYARVRARESKDSRGMANCSRPVRLIQSMLMPVQIATRVNAPHAVAQFENAVRRLSVTSTTCAGHRSALRGELAWGRKETQSVSVVTPEAGAPGVSVTWSSRLAARAETIAIG